MKIANENYELMALAIHRVEVTDFRNGEERETLVIPIADIRQAKFTFDGRVLKEAKHMVNNWTISATKVWTKIELYQDDILTECITLTTGTYEKN